MKKQFYWVFLLALLFGIVLTACTSKSKYLKNYAENLFTENNLDIESVSVVKGSFQGHPYFEMEIKSNNFSDLSPYAKRNILLEFNSIWIEGDHIWTKPEILSDEHYYSLNYDDKLVMDGELFSQKPTPTPFVMPTGDFALRWNVYDETYDPVGGYITIRRKGSTYTQTLICPDGSSETIELTAVPDGDAIRLYEKEGNAFGDYLLISSTGYLYFCDNQGVIYTVPPL